MQWLFAWGVFLSYWIDYAVAVTIPAEPRQWQIPIGLQLVPPGLLAFGLLFQKESVRWLVKKDRHAEGWESLIWIRGCESDAVRAELEEIQQAVREELASRQGFHTKELLYPSNRLRLGIAFGVFLSQQCTGATALAYFGPQFFKLLVGESDKDLLITGLFGCIKVISTGCFIIFFSERLGRRPMLMYSAIFMALGMTATAVVNKLRPLPGDVISSAGIGTVALIFLTIFTYCFSWGPLAWVYTSEVPSPYQQLNLTNDQIFPSRIREIGVAVGVSTQWLFNFVYSFATPYMISSMGSGTFLFYAGMDIAIAVFVFFCIKETRGKSIEAIERLFETRQDDYSGDCLVKGNSDQTQSRHIERA